MKQVSLACDHIQKVQFFTRTYKHVCPFIVIPCMINVCTNCMFLENLHELREEDEFNTFKRICKGM